MSRSRKPSTRCRSCLRAHWPDRLSMACSRVRLLAARLALDAAQHLRVSLAIDPLLDVAVRHLRAARSPGQPSESAAVLPQLGPGAGELPGFSPRFKGLRARILVACSVPKPTSNPPQFALRLTIQTVRHVWCFRVSNQGLRKKPSLTRRPCAVASRCPDADACEVRRAPSGDRLPV